eukprot:2871271-Prymnesium_polylepis.1
MDAKGEPALCGRTISTSSRAQERRIHPLLCLPFVGQPAAEVEASRATFECLRKIWKVSALVDPPMPARRAHILVIRSTS